MKRTKQMWSIEEISVLKAAYKIDTRYPAVAAQKRLKMAGYNRTLEQIRYKAVYCGIARCRAYKTGTTRMKNGNIQEKQPDGTWLWLSHVVLNRNGVNIPDGSIVYHRDGNALNNTIQNLAIKTRPELCKSITHKAADGRRKHPSTLDMLLQGKTPRMAGNNRTVWD